MRVDCTLRTLDAHHLYFLCQLAIRFRCTTAKRAIIESLL
jgi:hypothetical protein